MDIFYTYVSGKPVSGIYIMQFIYMRYIIRYNKFNQTNFCINGVAFKESVAILMNEMVDLNIMKGSLINLCHTS